MSTLIFPHVPCTGGATLIPLFAKFFSSQLNQSDWCFDSLNSLPERERNEIQFLHGHMPFGAHRYLKQPSTYITILRNPVIRVVSEYYYWVGMPGSREHDFITSNSITLDNYVERGYGHSYNAHCAVLSGLIHKENTSLEIAVDLPANVVDIVKCNLSEKCFLVGITELFDETLVMLRNILGLTFEQIAYKNLLVSKTRPTLREIGNNTISLIEKYNSYDLELYYFYKSLFINRADEYGHVFDDELSMFRKYIATK